jgi:hypothetical protein
MKRTRFTLAASGVVALLFLMAMGAPRASADIITTFTTSGTTSGGNVAGTATFDISGTGMTITLENTGPIASIAQVLDGLGFTLTGGTGLALTNVSAKGFETCTGNGNSTTCSPSGTGTSPYGWTLGDSYLLAAGAGSYKPYGIVNTGITGADGLGNSQHIPYLIGPVTFDFSFTTAPTGVTAATFYWGTKPETTHGSVPDGGVTLMLLGGALVGLETLRRRFRI